MVRKLLAAAGVIVLSCAGVAAEFWDDKAFTAWSDNELQRMLNDSPWSRRASVTVTPVAGGDAAGRRGGRGGGRAGGQQQPQFVVTWRSALPMKQALIRSQVGLNGSVPAPAQEMLDRKEEAYAVSITGLPMAFEALMDGAKDVTFLNRNGKPPIAPEEILSAPQPGGTVLMLAVFPRSAMIALEDGEVEFVTRLGPNEIKRTFNLKEMVYKGQLEL